ncbi:MAG: NAD+ synthase [Bacteroidetes bacterium]|nr:NAD+ synthase [Bacteroidota bacterium]MBV6460364.1 Glutamine-dependent NAD(+) synthetase [Flavobacteriales bacterium]WKZ74732.1 MAG: NAD+ synthase [Vicingaceae bacterium]MCL4815768.1 NAD+ synthase [Flavobacteriales bacterium]NOG95786.1 NAD+ synthase [Bacteroidota bacterium]
MKIALAQINSIVGDIEGNSGKIISYIKEAKEKEAELIIFPELSICGYPPDDLLLQNNFVEDCNNALLSIAEHCTSVAAIVGCPSLNKNVLGKPFFNSAFFLNQSKIETQIHKTLLPDYDVFDECRYFEPNNEFKLITFKNTRIALSVCEDIWFEQEKYYTHNPIHELKKLNPDLIINIAASPFHSQQPQIRFSLFAEIAKKNNTPIVYVNAVGANTDLVFDGNSCVYNAKGEIHLLCKSFEEDLQFTYIKKLNTTNYTTYPSEIENRYNALKVGVKDFFSKNNFRQAILGLSGGIDSALTLAIAADALGAENITAVLMPSKYSSEHSLSDSEKLLQHIPCKKIILPIQTAVDSAETLLSPFFGNKKNDITEENIQARIRGLLLMALANKHGYILLNTSNKSELAVGYGTLYGDLCGALSVLGDVYKTQVYELVNYVNRNKEIIPQHIITKAPSAELRPDQKDSDSLPDYSVLDKILFFYIEEKKNVEQIIVEGYDENIVMRTIRMLNSSEYKRFQAPPVIRVSKKAFGRGRKIPLVAKF